MSGTCLCLLLLHVTLAWSLPVQPETERPNPEGFKLENTAQNCIEPSPQKKVVLPCTYTGVDYECMTVKWYRVTKNTGCCARPAADYKYWKVPVKLVTYRNDTAKSVTVQLVIDHFNSSYSGLYFCQAYNPLYPETHIQSDHITEVAPTGSPVSPSLEYCSDQNSSQCDVPVPDVNPLILCAPTDALHRVCKPYSPQGISTLKYNVKDSSAYFQVRWSRPAVPCPGYTWRARMCQSDALVSQAGFTQTTTTENHTNTFQCTAPWNDNFEPNREYWKFNRLEQNTHYILQVERITENTSECTVFTSPSMFVGGYERPSIKYSTRRVTTERGKPVTLQCVVTGNPRPTVTFLEVLQPMTAPLHARGSSPKTQSDSFNWVHDEIHGPWVHSLTVTPMQNETYMCIAANSYNKGWGMMKEQVSAWMDVIVTDNE